MGLRDYFQRLADWWRSLLSEQRHGTMAVGLLDQTEALIWISDLDSVRPRLRFCRTGVLATLVRESRGRPLAVVGLLQSTDYRILPCDAPAVAPDELAQALRWRLQDRLSFPVEEAVVEVFELPEPTPPIMPRQVHAVVTHESVVRELVAQTQQARLPLTAIDIPELAWLNLCRRLPDKSFVLLHIDQSGSLALIIQQQILYVARHLEANMASLPGNLPAMAEELRRTVVYYESRFRRPPLDLVYVVPSAPELATHLPMLTDLLGLRAVLLPIHELITIDSTVAEADWMRSLPLIAAALGQTGVG